MNLLQNTDKKYNINTSGLRQSAFSSTFVNKPRVREDARETFPTKNFLQGRWQLCKLHGSHCLWTCSISTAVVGLCWTWLSVGQIMHEYVSVTGTNTHGFWRLSSSGTPLVRNARRTSNACFSASVRTGAGLLAECCCCFVRFSNIGANLVSAKHRTKNIKTDIYDKK